jgi:hypothetical protein
MLAHLIEFATNHYVLSAIFVVLLVLLIAMNCAAAVVPSALASSPRWSTPAKAWCWTCAR